MNKDFNTTLGKFGAYSLLPVVLLSSGCASSAFRVNANPAYSDAQLNEIRTTLLQYRETGLNPLEKVDYCSIFAEQAKGKGHGVGGGIGAGVLGGSVTKLAGAGNLWAVVVGSASAFAGWVAERAFFSDRQITKDQTNCGIQQGIDLIDAGKIPPIIRKDVESRQSQGPEKTSSRSSTIFNQSADHSTHEKRPESISWVQTGDYQLLPM